MATPRRRIRDSRRRHEASKYFNELVTIIYRYTDVILRFDDPTFTIKSDGTGSLFIPSLGAFERLTPRSIPNGLVFIDGSFLTIKEIFRYDYANTEDEPRIIRSEFSYHYQSPPLKFFFRYDYHPEIGDLTTHPLYHLHVGCWRAEEEKFSGKPRFRVPEVTLEEVLELIIRDFLT
ncbi:hypothetical protein H8E77_31710 [bacterium]|nr:hypothetical protein [bacterium]